MFSSLVENVEDYAIFAMDLSGRIVHWNHGAVHIIGFQPDEILGHPMEQIFSPEDVAAGAPQQELRAAASVGRAADERWHVRKDGSRFWALGIVVPIRAEDGEIIGFGKFLRDRTDLKQMQETLQGQNDALRRADENKDRFLATLAHELRNPLSVLTTSVHLLRKFAPSDKAISAEIERIQRQVGNTQRLIEDLADLSRARRSAMRLERRNIDLRMVAREAVDAVSTQAENRQHSLDMFLTETPVMILGDPLRVHQILVNLLVNSIRYTPAGGSIGLGVSAEDTEAVVRVKDNGIGIPPEKLATIFELFTQAHEEHAESQDGLGIGLNLARELTGLHGGTIQAASDGAGKGSEFIVRFPLNKEVGNGL